MKFLVRLIVSIIVNGSAIGLTAAFLPGIHIVPFSYTTLLLLGIVFGVINALIRPVVNVLSLPLTILSLGLWQLVLNALMLYLGSLFISELKIDGFWWAILGGIVMGIIGSILESIFNQFIPGESKRSIIRVEK